MKSKCDHFHATITKKEGLILLGLILVIIISGCIVPDSEEVEEGMPGMQSESGEESNEDTKKLIVTNPIDLSQIVRISKFRSCIGHDYSGLNINKEKESLRSMKHYVEPFQNLIGSTGIKIFAPFNGMVGEIRESPPGKHMYISSDAERSWNFIFFHVEPLPNIKAGTKVNAGQLIGHVSPSITSNFDFGLKQFIFLEQIFDSPFLHMTQSVLDEYREYGITPEKIIVPKSVRDNEPCLVQGTRNGDAVFPRYSDEDFVYVKII